MAYELTGTIKLIQDPKTFDSGFTKREIVVTVEDGNYPQDICLEFVQDKVSLLDDVKMGQDVTVTFDIRGREYNGRYYNNLQGWRINANEPKSTTEDSSQATEKIPTSELIDEDIPF